MNGFTVLQHDKGKADVFNYLSENSSVFVPELIPRVDVNLLAEKIAENAKQFWLMENTLVSGFASCYFNHPAREFGFINSISVIQPRQGRGLGSLLLEGVAQYARANSFKQIRLEVFKQNRAAIDFYYKHRFIILNDLEEKVLLGLNL